MSDSNNEKIDIPKATIPMPFDSYVRVSIRKPEIGIPFCKTHLPSHIAKNINFSTFKVLNRSFITPQMRNCACDVLIEFELNNQTDTSTKQPQKLNIAIIIEHQSTPDKFMAFRMFQYMFSYLQEKFEQRKSNSQLLDPIYPLLFYNGSRTPYPYSLNFYESFNDPHNIMKQSLNQKIKVIDVNLLDEDKLKTQQLLGIMTRAMKVRNITKQVSNYLSDLLIDLHLILTASDDENFNNIRDYIKTVITYLASISESDDLRRAINENDNIPTSVKGDYMTAAEEFIQQGIEKGILATAINALKEGFSVQNVVNITKLNITTVEQLKRELEH